MTPGSGIQRGDPLFRAIFALLTVFLVYQMGQDCPDVELFLHGDDDDDLFPRNKATLGGNSEKGDGVLATFGYLSGLHVNKKKSFAQVPTRI